MNKIKKDSKKNKLVEEVVSILKDMQSENGKETMYRATRRYNDRIFRARKK